MIEDKAKNIDEKSNKAHTKDDVQKLIYEKQRVIVRVWTSGSNSNHPGADVGHVSVQTPNQYMSLWPNETPSKDRHGSGLFTPVPHQLKPSYQADFKLEQRAPELTLVFYSLDPNRIEQRFDELKRILKGWSLFGLTKNGESCASLAWDLLCVGGIEKLAGKLTQSSVTSSGAAQGSGGAAQASLASSAYTASSNTAASKEAADRASQGSFYSSEMSVYGVIKSPDALGEVLKKAKQQELTTHNLTSTLSVAGEWQPPALKKGCVIM